MKKILYSDRTCPNNSSASVDVISVVAWNGIKALLITLIEKGNLAKEFPQYEDSFVVGVDVRKLNARINSILKNIDDVYSFTFVNVFDEGNTIQFTNDVLDLIEFVYQYIVDVEQDIYLERQRINAFKFLNTDYSQNKFRVDVNQIFSRNHIAYVLGADGYVRRKVDEVSSSLLSEVVSSEHTIETFMNEAKTKFLNPDLNERKLGLERLWDAFERIKTKYENSALSIDKRASVEKLIKDVTTICPNMFNTINAEANELTSIGNNYRIRHSEMNKIEINDSKLIDYLFFRMYSLMNLLIN